MVKPSDFELREAPLRALADGEARVRVLYLSFDPAMRGWMEDRPSYIPPVQIGEVMRAGAVGQVVESRSPDYKVGDFLQGTFGWQDYATVARGGVMPAAVLPKGVPLTWPLGVCGITGLTAYFGLLDLGKPKAGETVVVSGAAGATGSVVGQIAKLNGCRVIGIAGGAEKCGWLTGTAHFDAAIDYKNENVARRLHELCPKGLDVYFDNVGGEILDAALGNLGQRARRALRRDLELQRGRAPARPAQPDEPCDHALAHGGLHRDRLPRALRRGGGAAREVGGRGEDRARRGHPARARERAADLPAPVPGQEPGQAALEGGRPADRGLSGRV